jgi:hypothetical protein
MDGLMIFMGRSERGVETMTRELGRCEIENKTRDVHLTLTLPNRAARINLASSPSPPLFLFFGGIAKVFSGYGKC